MTTALRRGRRSRAYRRDLSLLDALPQQGDWSEEEYLWLTDRTNRLVEFSDGIVEVLPMPTEEHQRILLYLYRLLYSLVELAGGKVVTSPMRLQLPNSRFREPDLLLLLSARDPRRQNRYWLGADFVIEVVSPDDPKRDTVQKRREYARAGIPEYWIVDPIRQAITVLQLDGKRYAVHGTFRRGETATSVLVPTFVVDVSAALDAE